jgi:predicted outer membrane repeat protein
MNKSIHFIIRIIVIAGLAVAGTVSARADRYVSTHGDDSGNTCTVSSSPCETIGAAVAAAASGEVVNIAAGIYKESITVERPASFSLTLQGGWDEAFATLNVTTNKTVLSGGKSDRALRIASDGVSIQTFTLDGLTIEKSTATSRDSYDEKAGGAVLAESHSGSQLTLNINQVTFNKNKATPGAGALRMLALDSSTMTVNIADSSFLKNKAGGEGGAIEADTEGSSMTLNIERSLFDKNKGSSKSGGALDTESRGGNFEVNLDRVAFSKNKAGAEGGGAIQGEANEGHLEYNVTNCSFLKNKSVGPGGAFQFESQGVGGGIVEIVNATFAGNTSSKEGGGIFLESESGSPLTMTLINSIVQGNKGKDGADVHGEGFNLDASAGYNNVGDVSSLYADLGGNIDLDSMFVDLRNGNLHLKAGSPMIDAGSCAMASPHDFDGDARPSGTGCDIGADEFVAP